MSEIVFFADTLERLEISKTWITTEQAGNALAELHKLKYFKTDSPLEDVGLYALKSLGNSLIELDLKAANRLNYQRVIDLLPSLSRLESIDLPAYVAMQNGMIIHPFET